MADQTESKTIFKLDAAIPHPKPVDKSDWPENQVESDRELKALVAHYGGIMNVPAFEILRYHRKWSYPSGHRHLGQAYNDLSKNSGIM